MDTPAKYFLSAIGVICLALMLAMGCSSGGIMNDLDGLKEGIPDTHYGSQHYLGGLWQFVADPAEGTLDAFLLRTGNFHLNALPFLEPPPLLNLSLESLKFEGNKIDCEIGLRHPFLGLTEFTGFDVCGILITSGSVTGFTDPDLRMAGAGDMRLLNPDGWTRWWNPAEFPYNGTIFGYIDGLLGAPDSYGDYNSTLNAYKYFSEGLASDDNISKLSPTGRGIFRAGQKNVRRYIIDLGETGLVFNYAVDACWEFPQGDAPWVAPNDFSPNANRSEAYRLSIAEIDKTLIYDPVAGKAAGEVTLRIDVYDWFDADKNEVTVECGDIFAPVSTATPIDGGVGYSTYKVDILDAQPKAVGTLELFITVGCQDVGYQGILPDKKVASYFKYSLYVPEGQIVKPFPCGELFWSDDFDSYSNGQYPLPSPWTIFWSGNPSGCRVTSEQSYSPPYSWRSADYSSWARYDAVPMTRKDHFCYEARMMLTQNYFPGRIGFAWKKTSSTTGHFCAYGLSGPDYVPYHWYHIYSEVDCVNNKWRLWIDDELKVDIEYTDEVPEYTFDSFFIGTGNHTSYPESGVVYFDDVKFWVDQ